MMTQTVYLRTTGKPRFSTKARQTVDGRNVALVVLLSTFFAFSLVMSVTHPNTAEDQTITSLFGL